MAAILKPRPQNADVLNMQKSDIRIMVIDDDNSFSAELQDVLEREGYTVKVCQSAAQASRILESYDFHLAVIDILLPDKSGLDLGKSIHDDQGVPIMLMSGVLKDKKFIKTAKRMIPYKEFLTKPFRMGAFCVAAGRILKQSVQVDPSPLLSLLMTTPLSANQKFDRLQNQGDMQGYDLAQVYHTLMDINFSGELHARYEDSDVIKVFFHHGFIYKVTSSQPETYSGSLLVASGFVSQDEVAQAIQNKGASTKLGEALVNEHLISPHTIPLMQRKQIIERLSQSLRSKNVIISIHKGEGEHSNATIDKFQLADIMEEWMRTKIPSSYINNFYSFYLHYSFEKGPRHKLLNQFCSHTLLQLNPHLKKALEQPQALMSFLNQFEANEHKQQALQALHWLFMQGVFALKDIKKKATATKSQLERFQITLKNMEKKNSFEILGLSNKAKDYEVEQAFRDLTKIYHPDSHSKSSSPEVLDISALIFSKINTAYQDLNTKEKRESYLKEKIYNVITRPREQMREAVKKIGFKRYKEALSLLEQVRRVQPNMPELILYTLIAKLKVGPSLREENTFAKSIRNMQDQVPIEEKKSALFLTMRGLYYAYQKDLERAQQFLRNATKKDPSLSLAQQELEVIQRAVSSQKQGNVFSFLNKKIG